MRKDPEVFLAHILESIDLIEGYSEGKTREEFVESPQLQDAIIRRIEIVGEAVKNLPEDFKKDHPEIAWQKIAVMRDVLIHQYFGVDLALTWDVIQSDVPDLKLNISRIKERME
jgi:uncharacterized protein with HEPN domain